MVPCSTGGTDASVNKESGTCPSGTDEPPGKATFIATLRGETVPGQAWHKLAVAPSHTWPPRSETADADSLCPRT
ncbi:MAG: hypothetical protein J5939_08585 [Bacteroidales bacterium]|nr:hypothetical protein [Bacteroidales bacterium]